MSKIIFELDSKLMNGEIIVVDKDKLKSRSIRELLPELTELERKYSQLMADMQDIKEKMLELAKIVREK